ncbi:MAG: tetratricopeptide repeat protein [Gaiellaceae bacterium]
MGRSSQRKRSRQRENARRRQQSARNRAVKKAQAPAPSTTTSGYSPALENTMFFMRLRRGAKWAMVVVMLAFAFSFLFAGVGSGGSGGDIIQELLGMRGGDPVKSAEKDVAKRPHDAKALSSLALAYDGKGRRGDAINTYEKYLKIKPKDTSALSQLARLQNEVTSLRWARYERLQSRVQVVSGPFGSDPLQTLAGPDTLLGAYSSMLAAEVGSAYNSYTTAAKGWESSLKRYAQAVPKTDPFRRANIELQIGDAASSAGDYSAAIKSYQTFLSLTPKDSRVPQVKKVIAQLRKISKSG